MDKPKLKVNVKQFVADFRKGTSDEDLRRIHGLNRRGMDKLLAMLVERRVLDPSEVVQAPVQQPPVPEPEQNTIHGKLLPRIPSLALPETGPEQVEHESKCPQCGAQVGRQILTCPECGHVLPGEQRWSNLKSEKGIFDRINPIVLGCLIALPIAVAIFLVFKYIVAPMSAASMEKRAKVVSAKTALKKHSRTNQNEPAPQTAPIVKVFERLQKDGVLESADENFAAFTVGARWTELTSKEKAGFLKDVGNALGKSNLDRRFDVKTVSGEIIARGTEDSVEILEDDFSTPPDSQQAGAEKPEPGRGRDEPTKGMRQGAAGEEPSGQPEKDTEAPGDRPEDFPADAIPPDNK